MILSLKEFAEACNAIKVCGKAATDENKSAAPSVANLLFDSRRLNTTEDTVFFAIKTANNDGHRYINELYDKGIRIFVCQNEDCAKGKDATFFIVEDSLKALQDVAKYIRKRFSGKVVAITGSNGKTIVKEWTKILVGEDKKICFTPRSYNSQIGVPISLWQLDQSHEAAVLEAGISAPNQMQALQEMILPDTGLITNIGEAHGVNFSSEEEKINEKLQLFKGCKTLICSQDNSVLFERVKTFCQQHNIELLSYLSKEVIKDLPLPFSDKVSCENAASAFVLSKQLGIKPEKIKQRMRQLTALDMRMQIKQSIGGSVLVNDCYCLDFTSLEAALDFLNTQNPKLQRIAILSDLQEKDRDTTLTLGRINTLLKNKGVSFLYGIGTDFVNNDKVFDLPHHFFSSADEFLLKTSASDFAGKAILLKGSRKAELERISKRLETLSHQSVLKVNLSALDENVRYFKSQLKPDTLLMGMVKASSYGCGGSEVARQLQQSLADYLTVAFADEGITLRNNGITLPIMVVTLEADALEKMQEYNLEPVVHNFASLNLVKDLPLKVHIKADTGMHRLGFEQADLPRLIDTLKQHPNLHIASVFSHFACADSPEQDNFTALQINKFTYFADALTQAFDYKILRHICNSAGIIRFPQAHFDMVRLGVGMYGIGWDKATEQHLRYVHSLETCLTEIRTIAKGESVSYMRNFIAKDTTTIGVIPVGYADGVNRHLSERGFKVWINSHKAPIVGNICMDMCMINLSGIDAKVGDRVVIFGEENPVDNMAKALDTISYEIFTSVSERIKRVYYHE